LRKKGHSKRKTQDAKLKTDKGGRVRGPLC
jgi:hypothetical protein